MSVYCCDELRVVEDAGELEAACASCKPFNRLISLTRKSKSVNGAPPCRAQCTRPCLSIRIVEWSGISSKSSVAGHVMSVADRQGQAAVNFATVEREPAVFAVPINGPIRLHPSIHIGKSLVKSY